MLFIVKTQNNMITWEIGNISLLRCFVPFAFNTVSNRLRIDLKNLWIVSSRMWFVRTSASCLEMLEEGTGYLLFFPKLPTVVDNIQVRWLSCREQMLKFFWVLSGVYDHDTIFFTFFISLVSVIKVLAVAALSWMLFFF